MTDPAESPAVVELPDAAIKALVEAASGIDIMPELLARVPEAVEYVNAWRKTLIDNGSLREESPTNEFLGVVTIAATWAVNGVIAAHVRAEALSAVSGDEAAMSGLRNAIVLAALGGGRVGEAIDTFAAAVRAEAVAAERQRVLDGANPARAQAMREVENYVGPNLAGWPAFPGVYFGGLVDRVISAYAVATGSVPVAIPEPTARDERPHSRACGLRQHEHGSACAVDCPTCAAGGGWHYPVTTPTEPQASPVPAEQPDGWGEGVEAADHPVNCGCASCVIDRLRESNDSLREQLSRAIDEVDGLRAEQPEER